MFDIRTETNLGWWSERFWLPALRSISVERPGPWPQPNPPQFRPTCASGAGAISASFSIRLAAIHGYGLCNNSIDAWIDGKKSNVKGDHLSRILLYYYPDEQAAFVWEAEQKEAILSWWSGCLSIWNGAFKCNLKAAFAAQPHGEPCGQRGLGALPPTSKSLWHPLWIARGPACNNYTLAG